MHKPASNTHRPSPERTRSFGPRRRDYALLLAPAGLFFVVLFLAPIAVMLIFSLLSGNPMWQPDVTLTTQHYDRLLGDVYYLDALLNTLELGLWVTVISVIVAYPLAYRMVRIRSSGWRTAFFIAVLSPMMTGLVIRTYAWMTILADQGVINDLLRDVGLTTEPLGLMYNMFGIVVAMVHIFVPFMVLTLVGVLGRIDPSLEQAARSLGAGKTRTFIEVTLPLSVPGILAGSLLVFALTVSSYVTPVLMGGFSFFNLPILIYQQISSSFNPGFAAALGFLLLSISLVLIIAYHRVAFRAGTSRATVGKRRKRTSSAVPSAA